MFKTISFTFLFLTTMILCTSCIHLYGKKLVVSSEVLNHVKRLNNHQPAVRIKAAKKLGAIKDSRSTPALVKALCDKDMNVRMYAAYALGEIKDQKAARGLLKALSDPEWCVRDQAAWALREINNPEITNHLIKKLRASEVDVNRSNIEKIIWILSSSGHHEALEQLKKTTTVEKNSQLHKALHDYFSKSPEHQTLAAFWSFDDKNLKIATDITGFGNNGQITGCSSVSGKVGAALKFSGKDFISLGKPPGLMIANCPFTIMAWIRPVAPDGVVVARGGAFCGYSLYLKDGVAKFGIHRTQDGPAYIAAGSEVFTGKGRVQENLPGSWIHLAGVVKKNQIEIYVNGKLGGTTETPGFIPSNCGQGMEIGYDMSTTSAEIMTYFKGIIDEVRAYSVALSEEDILKQFNQE